MAEILRGKVDRHVKALQAALEAYEREHPGASASLYRRSPGVIKVRLIDDRFSQMSRGQRHREVWDFLAEQVDEDTMQQLYVLLPLTSDELSTSMANMDYEDPLPSVL